MNFWQCKCGALQAWESGSPPMPCEVCAACGSTMGMSPETHSEPTRHEWTTRYDASTGVPYHRCGRCGRKRPDLKAAGIMDWPAGEGEDDER